MCDTVDTSTKEKKEKNMKLIGTTPATPATITIEMTESQAQSLLIITQGVGGIPERTRRGDIDTLAEVLTEAGIDFPLDYNKSYPDRYITGSLIFRESE